MRICWIYDFTEYTLRYCQYDSLKNSLEKCKIPLLLLEFLDIWEYFLILDFKGIKERVRYTEFIISLSMT